MNNNKKNPDELTTSSRACCKQALGNKMFNVNNNNYGNLLYH